MANNWYYAKHGKRLGPFAWTQLQQLAKSAMLVPTDMVFPESTQQWMPAGNVPGLFQPPPQRQASAPVGLPVGVHFLEALPVRPQQPAVVKAQPPSIPSGATKKPWLMMAIGLLLLLGLMTGLGIVALYALTGWGSGYKLARKELPVGAIVREEYTMVMMDGTVTLSSGGEVKTGRVDLQSTNLTELEVTAVSGKEPSKLTIRHLSDSTRMKFRLPGQAEETSTENGAFHGRSISVEKRAGIWRKTLIGDKPTPQQERELEAEWDWEDGYPDRGLKVGESWKVEGSRLRRIAGMNNALAFQGTATLTFEKVVQHLGEECALIRFQMDVKARGLDEDNRDISIELAVSGFEYRSLASLTNINTELSGQMKLTGSTIVEGKVVGVTFAGPVKLSANEKRR